MVHKKKEPDKVNVAMAEIMSARLMAIPNSSISDYIGKVSQECLDLCKDFMDIVLNSPKPTWSDECKPFWTMDTRKLADTLFLPTSENIITDVFQQQRFNKNKWFRSEFYVNGGDFCKKIEYTPENTIEPITKCRQINMYLTPIQKSTMVNIIGMYRFFYNRTISFINNFNFDKYESWFYKDLSKGKTIVKVKLPKK